jgi:hypothetical protein
MQARNIIYTIRTAAKLPLPAYEQVNLYMHFYLTVSEGNICRTF